MKHCHLLDMELLSLFYSYEYNLRDTKDCSKTTCFTLKRRMICYYKDQQLVVQA